jgi:hypothetical protein
MTLPAGDRLRKGAIAGNAWPIRSYTYTSKAEADEAAKALQQYIDTEANRLARNSQKRGRR